MRQYVCCLSPQFGVLCYCSPTNSHPPPLAFQGRCGALTQSHLCGRICHIAQHFLLLLVLMQNLGTLSRTAPTNASPGSLRASELWSLLHAPWGGLGGRTPQPPPKHLSHGLFVSSLGFLSTQGSSDPEKVLYVGQKYASLQLQPASPCRVL